MTPNVGAAIVSKSAALRQDRVWESYEVLNR